MAYTFTSNIEYKSLANPTVKSKNGESNTALTLDDGNNPFDQRKTWDEFKKEYYQLEKKIKKSLENLHLIQIEFTKHISLIE